MDYTSQNYFRDITKKFKFYIIAALAGCMIISGCGKPGADEEKLVNIYADIVIARDTTTNLTITRQELDKAIFKKYNVTPEEYEESIKSMNENPEQWEQFFDKVIIRIQKLQKVKK